jgi:hypothetical protein
VVELVLLEGANEPLNKLYFKQNRRLEWEEPPPSLGMKIYPTVFVGW